MVKELTIHKVEKKFIVPNQKKFYLFPSNYFLMSLDKFRQFVEKEMENFHGEFLLKDNKGKPFARFKLENGKMKKIWRCSPTTKRMYPIWNKMC
jgi:hypothetical protein|tara:strand:+ start:412 stop:693 length:282 start_codon:yes stop_codon:yes gene_type:complete